MQDNAPSQLASPSGGWHEQLSEMLMESIPCSVVLVDRALRVVLANRNFLERMQRGRSVTIQTKISELFPNPILETTQLEAKLRRAIERGESFDGEKMTYRAPGIPTRTYYYRIAPVTGRKRNECAMLLVDDVTEVVSLAAQVRLAERHLASVVESAQDLVVSTDALGHIISWNPAAERTTGYQINEMRGRSILEICESADQGVMQAMIDRLRKGQTSQSIETRLASRSGRPVSITWTCSSMCDESRTVTALVAVGRDLSERRAFERRLHQNEKLAALGILAGGIAHELRNPLAVSYSAAQFLREKNGDQAFRAQCVAKILDGVERASSIIDNLLRFARRSDADDPPKAVDLVSVVRDTVALFRHQCSLQKITVKERYAVRTNPVLGNTTLLQQIAMNLIVNAYNAMPDGGDLDIEVWHENGEVILSVGDTGHGIAEEDRGRIFDPFFTRGPAGQGTGLGLSICHTIVSGYGGTIGVESRLGEGSRFSVHLPGAKA